MSMSGGFRRMVVGLPQTITDRDAVDAAADIAEFLKIEILATFLADSSLHALAGLPAARELRILDRGWQAIDLEQIRRDLDRAASVARRYIAEAVGGRGIKSNFDVITGAAMLSSLIRADDIVAIIEPPHPGERITSQFAALLAVALQNAAAVLVVPQRIAHRSGPIMALPTTPEDASLGVALELAALLKERLIVATPYLIELPAALLTAAENYGVQVVQINAAMPTAAALAASPARTAERLRVVDARNIPVDATRLFSVLQGIPLLLIDPTRIADANRC